MKNFGLKFFLSFVFIMLVCPAFGQLSYLDPVQKLEDVVIRDANKIVIWRETATDPLLVYEKTYYVDPTAMKTMVRKDYEHKRVYYYEFSPDSSAYLERIENAHNQTIFVQEWKKNEFGEFIHQSRSESDGSRLLINNADYKYNKNQDDQTKHLKIKYSTDHFTRSKRVTNTYFLYNKHDSLKREYTITRRGLKVLHWGTKKYEYDDLKRLVKTTIKSSGENRVIEYSYDAFGRKVVVVNTSENGAVVSNYQYEDSVLVEHRKFVTTDGNESLYTWQYDVNGKLQLKTVNYDSTLYAYNASDSLTEVITHHYARNGDFLRTTKDLNMVWKDGNIVERSVINEEGGRRLEKYEYQEGQLVKFESELRYGKEIKEYVIKEYQYDIRGHLSRYSVSYPNSENTQYYYVEISFF